jgi:hypothetical protein
MLDNGFTYSPDDLDQWIINYIESYMGTIDKSFKIPEDKLVFDLSIAGIDEEEKTIKYIILLN